MTSTDEASPSRTRSRRLGRAALYALVTGLVLFGVGFLVRSKWDPLISLDDDVITRLTDVTRDHPGLREAFVVWQAVTQPINLHVVGTLVCLWVWLRKGMRTRAWWAFATLMLSWFVGLVAKYVFQRARPVVEDPVSEAPGYSFPSGHAVNSAAWVVVLLILLWPLLKTRASRTVAVALGAVVVVVTALDRMFLGVHYPSDVTVGILTGAGLVLASYAGYTGWNPGDPDEARDPDTTQHPADTDVASDRTPSRQEP
ncbi:phosphatase PAP2 family protein [Arthrobacter sp. NEB 688]|uniref:phosphatase PAP2 family protein n=1 Tax=Arthrobacter sp. NEB 688 TaxID=904039 RepID=UPI001567A497|nr:phosphatase PAP2 family protein [Arthrobacter sp. NEB 688]QKE83009.1 phosphatase PAP2 family protein [Arthrobacter sp. NEB 688]